MLRFFPALFIELNPLELSLYVFIKKMLVILMSDPESVNRLLVKSASGSLRGSGEKREKGWGNQTEFSVAFSR